MKIKWAIIECYKPKASESLYWYMHDMYHCQCSFLSMSCTITLISLLERKIIITIAKINTCVFSNNYKH